MSTYILGDCAEEITPILTNISTTSLTTGAITSLWRTANVLPIFKKGSKMSTKNYRPVSLTSVVSKILEHISFTATFLITVANTLVATHMA